MSTGDLAKIQALQLPASLRESIAAMKEENGVKMHVKKGEKFPVQEQARQDGPSPRDPSTTHRGRSS